MYVALAAARAGHYVIPLWPRTKIPALHGEHTCPGSGPCADGHRGWEQRATRDPRHIRVWWATSPLNVGIATGISGLHVLDLDPSRGEPAPDPWAGAEHGRDVLARLAEQAGRPYPDDTFAVRTPSGGEHLYFRAPDEPELRNTVARLGWRVDSRGGGGYIVAAGSVRRAGVYRVIRDRPIAVLPGWLVPLLAPPAPAEPVLPVVGDLRPVSDRRKHAYLDTVFDRVAHAEPGVRRYTLLRAAYTLGRLVAGGDLGDDEARAGLHTAASRLCGVSARDIDRAIEDGLRYGSRSPRRLIG